MGQGIITTRQLQADDFNPMIKLAYKACVESGLITTEFNEQHFFTMIKKALISVNWRCLGVYVDDELLGFAMLNYGTMPWNPKKKDANLQYFFTNNGTSADVANQLYISIHDWCQQAGIERLIVSDKTCRREVLVQLGFVPCETIYERKINDVQD